MQLTARFEHSEDCQVLQERLLDMAGLGAKVCDQEQKDSERWTSVREDR